MFKEDFYNSNNNTSPMRIFIFVYLVPGVGFLNMPTEPYLIL